MPKLLFAISSLYIVTASVVATPTAGRGLYLTPGYGGSTAGAVR